MNLTILQQFRQALYAAFLVEVKLVRVERERATAKKRDPKVSRFMVVEPAGVAEPLELAEPRTVRVVDTGIKRGQLITGRSW